MQSRKMGTQPIIELFSASKKSACLVQYNPLLMPANEVWDKVIFSEVSVILSREGSLYDVTSCLAAWSHYPFGGPLSLVSYSFYGVSVQGVFVQGDL